MAGFYSDSPVQDQIDADELSATEAKTAAEAAQAAAEAAQAAAETAEAGAEASELAAGSSETNAAQSATSAANSATSAATQAASASSSASSAASSDSSAAASASNAAASATAAATSASTASGHETTASTKASEASASAANAAASETAAGASELAAASSESAAASSATAAASSATTAATEAGNAATSATAAAASETNAASSATAAAASETAAAASETAAASSETAAAASETAAGTSETNAAGSATAAASSASAAASSATAAGSSESAAAGSATAAASSATDAATSASNAATSETNAATSETNAATSASNAATSETNAATSATNAATSETNASGSATSAASSASAAGSARDAALAALDSFDDRYLGQKTSDPSLDNDGNALISGALYFDSTNSLMKVYDGSQWLAAYASTSGSLLAANNLSDLANAATARTNLGLGTAATTASTAYATAAQGALADSATQPGDNVSTLANDAGYLTSFTEADPVFSASAAAGISATNITNWNTAYAWGNHASAGYLTSFTETDPVFSASAASGITSTNITNWNTAYGWGDHASAGYLTGNQTITLSGDASGSGTTSIVVTVADDSHNHIISNVDGLQTALDGKLGSTSAAVSAAKWTTARTVSLTGAVTGSASVDGSANVSIATTATSDPTLTLSGDATGSATFTNLGNATLSVTVVDDSHNHVISNVDGLQTALDGKQAASTALGYVDVATGNYGTIKVDDDRGVTWAGYAIRDDWVFMSNGAGAAGIYNDTNNAWNIYFEQSASTSLRWGGDGTEQARTESGYFAANGSFRAPLFYDIDNTAFYSDPAGATVLNYLRLDSTAAYQLYTNNQYLNIRYGSTGAGGIRLYDSGDVLQGYWNANGAGEHGFLDNDGQWAVRVRTSTNPLTLSCDGNEEFYVYNSYTYSPGSSRAPLFYDSNNTNYYMNPASTSVINSIYLEGIIYHNGDTNTYIQFHAADQFRVVTGGSERLEVANAAILASVEFRCTSNITAYYSDERLKDFHGAIDNPVEKVKQLGGYYFTENAKAKELGYDNDGIQVGVNAQEVQRVMPEVIATAPISYAEGVDEEYLTVQYEKLVPLLIEAIKEQAGQIEALQAEVAKLKG